METFSGQRVVIVGLGRTAFSLANLLLRHGAEVCVSENQDSPAVRERARSLEAAGARVEVGGHTGTFFEGAEVVVPGPGVSPAIPPIVSAREQGAKLVGELEYSARFCSSRIIAVTGTNGKTTVTEWIAAMIRSCGHSVELAGNNATPLSDFVLRDSKPLYVVIEVSSYQAELIDAFRPWIAAVLNITPDHLGRHGDLDSYARAKLRLFSNQGVGDHSVVNADDPELQSRVAVAGDVRLHRFSLEGNPGDGIWLDGDVIRDGGVEIARRSDIRLPGKHNLSNALAALAVVRAGLFEDKCVRRGLYAFEGVEHRLERVATLDHVTYVNDSKATNLSSMRAALNSFERPVVLLAGGEGKGEDCHACRDVVRDKVKAIVAFGRDRALFDEAFHDLVPVVRVESVEEAVHAAREMSSAGDVVLLSPGCASFDQFANFEERGRRFKEIVAGPGGTIPV